jgi:hypothetical protein
LRESQLSSFRTTLVDLGPLCPEPSPTTYRYQYTSSRPAHP